MSGVGCDFCLWLFLDFSVYLLADIQPTLTTHSTVLWPRARMNIFRNSGRYGADGMSLSGNFVKTWFWPQYIWHGNYHKPIYNAIEETKFCPSLFQCLLAEILQHCSDTGRNHCRNYWFTVIITGGPLTAFSIWRIYFWVWGSHTGAEYSLTKVL